MSHTFRTTGRSRARGASAHARKRFHTDLAARASRLVRYKSFWIACLLLIGACSSGQLGEGSGTEAQSQGIVAGDQSAPAGAPPTTPAAPGSPSSSSSAVWVLLKDQASLKGVGARKNWRDRGKAVEDTLKRKAQASQGRLRTLLSTRRAKVRAFWIVNALRVEADKATLDALAVHPDVARILPDRVYQVPPIKKDTPALGVRSVEWGLDNIGAPLAWDEFGSRGEGIVIANIDTGVEFDHSALGAQYRGNLGNGSYDHNYNWLDPANVCGFPSNVPCDNAGHGTHTMGTMVGDDGDPGENQIGVAPHAKWIAAKGCEDWSCSLESLLASAEWILAPTDLNGQNPRPDLRPNIVNNSWGGWGGDPFYQAAVQAWVEAGIFPAFSAGNSGPGCGSLGSPGDYPESYGVAAYDITNTIADFSSRGPSAFGVSKPNIAAPGVSVRSSVPGNGYDFFSGTSMAAPHLAGTVALMWSAAPALLGDIETTRALLDQTATDTSDLSCGGTPENNYVWGEGRLNARAAVEAAPRGPTGTLEGAVQKAETSEPLAFASVVATAPGLSPRRTTTDASGRYRFTLPIGDFDVTASLFAYVPATVAVVISEGATTVQDFALALAPAHGVSGTVRDTEGVPLAGVNVSIVGTPITPAVTDASGNYSFPSVPEGDYSIRAALGHCYDDQVLPLTVAGPSAVDFTLSLRVDAYGYSCAPSAFDYVPGDTLLTDWGWDDSIPVELPFDFTYYGQTYSQLKVNTNGLVHFTGDFAWGYNTPIPDTAPPNAAIYGFWDDLYLDNSGSGGSGGAAGTGAGGSDGSGGFGGSSGGSGGTGDAGGDAVQAEGGIFTGVIGTAPNREFIIEWRDAVLYDTGERTSFEIILSEQGGIRFQYPGGGSPAQRGSSATIGIEDERGVVGLQYSYNEASIEAGMAIAYTLPPMGFVTGTVRDQNDGLPIKGALVRALAGETQVRAALTNGNGQYRMQIPLGLHTISAGSKNYVGAEANVTVEEGATHVQDFALKTARAEVTPPTIQLVLPVNQVRERKLVLSNTGSSVLDWETFETGGRRQVTTVTRKLKRNPAAAPNAPNTRALYQGTPAVKGWTPDAPGDVLTSFPTSGLNQPWGIGFDGNVWASDIGKSIAEFGVDGTPTGRSWMAGWSAAWPADMAYDPNRQLMCQVNVGGDNGIYCWDPATGAVADSITGAHPWTGISQRGLAYRDDDDTFYIGGWNEGIIYHVKGLSHTDRGAVVGSCSPADGNISGLAWNGSMGVLWAATNSETDTVYELNPDDCTVLSTIAHPTPGYAGAGLEMDDTGNLWTISQATAQAYLIESGVPASSDVPWLSASPSSGSLAPGGATNVTVRIDTTGLESGVYLASLFVRSNSGRNGQLRIPVSLIVTDYQQGIDAGGKQYTDQLGDSWAADRAHTAGAWGYVQKGSTASTTKSIAGTADPKLYKTQRVNPYAYRFDSVPNGVYQVEFLFAEISGANFGKRLFDVIVEDTMVLPAHDITYEVGKLTAENRAFFVQVVDNRMDVRFIPRAGSLKPVINALRVTRRPDR